MVGRKPKIIYKFYLKPAYFKKNLIILAQMQMAKFHRLIFRYTTLTNYLI